MKKRILIVDDDPLLNQINQKVLATSGLVSELHIVKNGKEALEYLNTRLEKSYPLPDIIILDLHMPLMDGFQFIDAFQKLDYLRTRIELVVFTSSSSPRDKQRVYDKGVKHYLSKPYLLRGLTDVIRQLPLNQTEFISNKRS